MSNSALSARRAAAISRGVGVSSPLFATRAKNAELWDAEGRRYIDFASGIAVLNTGHGHPRVVAAVKAAVPPQINVLATAILLVSLILLAVGTLYRRKKIDI